MTLEPPREDLAEVVHRARKSIGRLAGRRVLIAGAAGFIGAYVAHALAFANENLLARPCAIVCLDRYVTGTEDRLRSLSGRPYCTTTDMSLLDLRELDADYVFHLASIASPVVYRRLPLETIEVNALGTLNLLRLAKERGVESFLYLSSSEVYGDPEPGFVPTGEDYVGRVSFTGPRACYDESKRLAETLCRVFFEQHGLPIKVARPFNVYGPGLRLDDGRIIPDLLRQGLAGGPLILHSDGTPTRSFCYITDAVVAFFELALSSLDGEAFNVGTPEEVAIGEVARLVGELFDISQVIQEPSLDARYLVGNPQRRCPDISKLTRSIDWKPRVPLQQGLARTVSYYKARGGLP